MDLGQYNFFGFL